MACSPAGQWLSLDVTPLVAGNGAVSLALTSTSKTTSSLASREGHRLLASSSSSRPRFPQTSLRRTPRRPPSWGTLSPGVTLTAQPGAWTGTQPIHYTYQWQRCQADGSSCTDLAEADDPSYVVAPDDAGNTLRASVTATNGAGSATAVSAATGVVGESDPVIAAAGDIACDPQSTSFNNGAGTATACRQQHTSDLLLDPTVFPDLTAVLPLGIFSTRTAPTRSS